MNTYIQILLNRKAILEENYREEKNKETLFRWAEVCNLLDLFGYEEPEPTYDELMTLINTLED